jgi:hypothetical protein
MSAETGPRPVTFTAVLYRPEVTGASTFLPLPPEAREVLGGGRVPVRVTIEGTSFRTTTQVRQGQLRIVVNADVRAEAGVEAGMEVTAAVVRDDGPRPVAIPVELTEALQRDPEASAAFDALAPSHRREWCRWVAEAKRADTRTTRADRTVAALRSGQVRRRGRRRVVEQRRSAGD